MVRNTYLSARCLKFLVLKVEGGYLNARHNIFRTVCAGAVKYIHIQQLQRNIIQIQDVYLLE